jgi:hypothetical protein
MSSKFSPVYLCQRIARGSDARASHDLRRRGYVHRHGCLRPTRSGSSFASSIDDEVPMAGMNRPTKADTPSPTPERAEPAHERPERGEDAQKRVRRNPPPPREYDYDSAAPGETDESTYELLPDYDLTEMPRGV